MVSAIQSQLGDWEVLDVDNALGGVWHVFTRSKHRWLPWKKMVGTGSIKVITCPVHIESRISATVSIKLATKPLKPPLPRSPCPGGMGDTLRKFYCTRRPASCG